MYLNHTVDPEYAAELDLPEQDWLCTFERLTLMPGGGAEHETCTEPAEDGSEPPRCADHAHRP